MNVFTKILRFLSKDVEYPRKAWLESILTAWSLTFSIIITIVLSIAYDHFWITMLLALITGGFVGCMLSVYFADRAKNKYKSIAKLTLVDCICFSFLLFKFWSFSEWELFILFFVLVMATTIIFIHFCVIVYQTTTILERGRVTSGILGSVVIAAPVVYFSLTVDLVKYLLYIILFLYIAYILCTKKHNEIFLSPRITFKEMFNGTIIKYLIILCGFGFIEGLFLNLTSLISDPSGFGVTFFILVLPAILFGSLVIAGLVLDLYGRRRSLSLIVFLLGSYAFLSSLETYVSHINASTAAYLAALILNVIAVVTIIGDISIAPAKILPILMVFDVGSIVGGFFVRNALLSTGIAELPFITGTFGLLIISIVLINTRDLLPEQEQSWDKALLAIYVMYNSGVLLYHQEFKQDGTKKDDATASPNQMGLVPDLISSGLVGITQLMQEIVQGKQIMRYIDNYSKKILLEAGKHIIVALIVLNDSRILRDKLRKFIDDFEIEFHDDLEKASGYDMIRFESTKDLIRKYFDVKYLMGFGARDHEGHPT
jgi:hypothetical protein